MVIRPLAESSPPSNVCSPDSERSCWHVSKPFVATTPSAITVSSVDVNALPVPAAVIVCSLPAGKKRAVTMKVNGGDLFLDESAVVMPTLTLNEAIDILAQGDASRIDGAGTLTAITDYAYLVVDQDAASIYGFTAKPGTGIGDDVVTADVASEFFE